MQVFLDTALYENAVYLADTVWHPGSVQSLHSFFSHAIGELEIQDLMVIEWEPALRTYRPLSIEVRNDLRHVIEIHHGSIGTTARFGKRWLQNTVRNALGIDSTSKIEIDRDVLVVAAAGPTLSESFEALRLERHRYQLWALPSAVKALIDQDLLPDLIILTDPGYYSVVHLAPVKSRPVPMAMPLTALSGVWRYASGLSLLHQGSYLESQVFASMQLPNSRLPPNGTVAGTALQLARPLNCPVVFAGLDFITRDIQSHVRPHAFEPIIEDRTTRTDTSQTRYYMRAFKARIESGADVSPLTTYAGWFSLAAASSGMQLYRLNPSPIAIPGMAGIDRHSFSHLCRNSPSRVAHGQPKESPTQTVPPKVRKKIMSEIITSLGRDIDRLMVKKEVDPRLFTGNGPESLIYYLSTGELLRFMKTGERRTFVDACNNALACMDELQSYAERWPC